MSLNKKIRRKKNLKNQIMKVVRVEKRKKRKKKKVKMEKRVYQMILVQVMMKILSLPKMTLKKSRTFLLPKRKKLQI
jgi:hypothetical protein